MCIRDRGEVVAAQTEKLTVSRPHPLWSEQDPEQWWQATDRAMKALGVQHSLQDVKALGIAGQMHGATLLDAQQRVLRPAILWNDGRCAQAVSYTHLFNEIHSESECRCVIFRCDGAHQPSHLFPVA